ncbi:unnamed protein product, partial [Adineta ricciae]
MNSDISDDESDNLTSVERQRPSAVHLFAKKIPNSTNYQCNLCPNSKVISCGVGTNANIRRHLASQHGLTQLKSKSHPERHTLQIDSMRKRLYDSAAIAAIIMDGRPFGDFKKK